MAKFLISNDFRISESSALKTIQLLQEENVDMQGLSVVSQMLTPEHLKRMLSRAFLGQCDVLNYAFGESLSSNSSDSEGSFLMQG